MSQAPHSTRDAKRYRYVGIVAALALILSVLLPPYVQATSLVMAVQPAAWAVLMAIVHWQFADVETNYALIGFILIMLGSVLDLFYFGVRLNAARSLIGSFLSITGLLFASVSFFWPTIGYFGIGYVISWFSAISCVVAARRASPPPIQMNVLQSPRLHEALTSDEATKIRHHEKGRIPTGYSALDGVLMGGLPAGSSSILTGPPCDEKDLIVKRFVETSSSSGHGCIYVCTTLDKLAKSKSKRPKNLQIILCNPQAETVSSGFPDAIKLNTLSLTEINLQYAKALEKVGADGKPTLCLEIIDDALIDHHISVRRWLMDILGRAKSDGTACLATFNPTMHPPEETQAVLETFDGNIELREDQQLQRKIIRVRKLAGYKFIEKDLIVEKGMI